MPSTYSIFRKFPAAEQAHELKSLLEQHGISCKLVDNVPPVDVTFSNSTIQNEYEIRIQQSDFEKAESVLEADAKNLINEVDGDYYLFDFTDEELYDILLKSDEWSSFDYTLAQKILIDRGQTVDKESLAALKQERLKELSRPEGNQKPWIITGYILAVLGGFLGLIIGYFLWTSKKSLPNGQKVYSYTATDRKHGKRIFIIGVIATPIWLVIRFSGLIQ